MVAQVVGSYYNGGMPRIKSDKLQPLPAVDILELCKVIENLTGYNQRQMAELLDISLNSYQCWRFENRTPNGNAVARLFSLRDELEQKLKIKILIPLKTKQD